MDIHTTHAGTLGVKGRISHSHSHSDVGDGIRNPEFGIRTDDCHLSGFAIRDDDQWMGLDQLPIFIWLSDRGIQKLA